MIPEYKIDLLNKSKKLINNIENVNSIIRTNKTKNISLKEKKGKGKEMKLGPKVHRSLDLHNEIASEFLIKSLY